MQKQMFIMSGPSGCGKSTLANKIKNNTTDKHISCEIYSTDNLFIENGQYKFDYTRLGEYHQKNKELVESACKNNIDVIIVDNTNLTKKERAPYIAIAKKYNYHITVVVPDTSWINNPEELSKKNTHGVPIKNIVNMVKKWEAFSYIEEVQNV